MESDISDIDISEIINGISIKKWRKILCVTTKKKKVLRNSTEMNIY